MAVALERHHLVDLLGAEAHDPAHVVAGQVDAASRARRPPWGARPARRPRRRSSSSVRPRRRVPAMGREITRPSSSCTIGSGDEPDQRSTAGWRRKYMYGLGFTWRSDPVEVERVGVEVEVEALGQHHLEDVAGEDVLLGHLDRGRRTAPSPMRGGDLGQRARPGRAARPAARRAGRAPSAASASRRRDGLVVGGVEVGVGRRRRDDDVGDRA